jgi:hypothetical protein
MIGLLTSLLDNIPLGRMPRKWTKREWMEQARAAHLADVNRIQLLMTDVYP